MKRIVLSLLFVFSVGFLYSQSQRLVLLEEFTQASCGPCASINPTIKALLESNPDKITSVWYHTSWPGTDPMNEDNPTEVAARVGYYGVTYVPWSVLDGNYYSGSASGWNINTVNNRYAVPSPFSMGLQHYLNAAQDSIFVTMVATASEDVSGSMAAHNVVIEKNIHFNYAPGSNGEKDFKNVMKKMLPTKDGTTLPTAMETGDYVLIQEAWKLANVYDKSQLAAVAFVQNKTSKEILQSVNSSVDALVLPYDNDLQVLEISEVSGTNCSGTIIPRITVRNNGNDAVASFDLKYRVNDESEATFSWSGSMASLQKVVLDLPAYNFTPLLSNTLKVYSSEPNSLPDEYMKNDTMTFTIAEAPITCPTIYVYIKTDNAPGETTWDVRTASGIVVASGGPYTTNGALIKDTVELQFYGCYVFNLYDAGGNGLCCSNGNGLFYVLDALGVTIAEGNKFGSHTFNEFNYTDLSYIPDVKQAGTLTVAPNPSDGNGTVMLTLNNASPVTAALVNTMGRVVKTWDFDVLPSGAHDFSLDAADLSAGLYILQVKAGRQTLSTKVAIVK